MRYPQDASLERPPEEYGVDRMEVEVRRRMQLTITNRPKTYPMSEGGTHEVGGFLVTRKG